MPKKQSGVKERVKTILWSIRTALELNAKVFILWLLISVIVSLLPALSVVYYQKIVAVLSNFLSTGEGVFADCLTFAIILGVIQLLNGICHREQRNLLESIHFLLKWSSILSVYGEYHHL